MRKYTLIFLCFALLIFGYCKYNHLNINDLGMILFSGIKTATGDAVDLDSIKKIKTPAMNHDKWSFLLKKHVTQSGKVDYKGFIQDSILLKTYLKELSDHHPGNNWSQNEELAYWINAYNAFTVKLIIDHYPLESIKSIGHGLPMINSPWDIKFFKIADVDFDLNTIEHEILRKLFDEPRVHFAINCASISCPKLRAEAYTSEELIAQLHDQTMQFINNPVKNRISNNELQLSKIFDWFKSDFTKEKTIVEYVQQYTDVPLSSDHRVKYIEYDWRLNE